MARKCLCSNDLNRYVTIKRLTIGAFSEPIDETDDGNWIRIGKEWVQMLTQGSVEYTIGDRVEQRTLYQVTMRWSPQAAAYTAKMRIEYEGRIFNIAGPPMNLDEKDKWLQLNAIEVPPTVI